MKTIFRSEEESKRLTEEKKDWYVNSRLMEPEYL